MALPFDGPRLVAASEMYGELEEGLATTAGRQPSLSSPPGFAVLPRHQQVITTDSFVDSWSIITETVIGIRLPPAPRCLHISLSERSSCKKEYLHRQSNPLFPPLPTLSFFELSEPAILTASLAFTQSSLAHGKVPCAGHGEALRLRLSCVRVEPTRHTLRSTPPLLHWYRLIDIHVIVRA